MKMKTFFLFSAAMMISISSWANHAIVNCGPEGYWTKSKSVDGGYYLWLMNDSTAQIQKAFTGKWIQIGDVTYGQDSILIEDIPLANIESGDSILGENFEMNIGEEFLHPSRKPRRYFYAQFEIQNSDGSVIRENLECVFGLK